jgi:hypothetical protein
MASQIRTDHRQSHCSGAAFLGSAAMRLASPNGVDIILKQLVELTMAVEEG